MAGGIAEPEGAEIAGALLGCSERARQVLRGDVEEHETEADQCCGTIKYRQFRPQEGQQQPESENGRAAQHRISRTEAIGDASGINGQQQRKHRIDRDQRADQKRVCAELDREQRGDHSAAHVAALDDHREQGEDGDRIHSISRVWRGTSPAHLGHAGAAHYVSYYGRWWSDRAFAGFRCPYAVH